MDRIFRPQPCKSLRLAGALFLLCGLPCGALAQSSDLSSPTPVYASEIAGRIEPRDFGDARRTRHYYAFRGVEGDLTITAESSELTGEVDLYVANTMRPLLRITMYGNPTPAGVTKSVYLRREELLLLRVEARAVSDAAGSYRIRLGGAFAPAPAGMARAEESAAPSVPDAGGRTEGTRRVTSTGARIPQPPSERAEESAAVTSRDETEAPAAVVSPAETRPGGRNARRETTRARRDGGAARAPANRRGRTSTPPADASSTEAARGETSAPEAERESAMPAERNPAPTARTARGARNRPEGTRRSTRPAPTRPAPEAATDAATASATNLPAPPQRLVVVTRDGQTLERDMSTVRRISVENNQLVIVTRDGKTVRQPMSNVQKMSIEP